ncbi:hypothetical protein PENSTE_c005G08743 [Penicillium steckii]|uniref:Uncharacterized protein n=1 Tax=Penicillium steckii TaxID=303698 RepID=A0A1V6TJ94_9EURO|nr:hypothetical protein PENSTE_c005G08743 [Penicillium steckii]
MSRSTASLTQWLQLRQTISAKSPSAICSGVRNLPVSTQVSWTSNHNAAAPRHCFHTTATRRAAKSVPKAPRAPGTIERERKAQWEGRRTAKIGMKGQLFLKSKIENAAKKSMGECLQLHEQFAGHIYDAAIANDELPKEISFKTYNDIGVKLITAAFEQETGAAAVRAISVDVDAVFRIGHFVALPLEEPILGEWILSSCAQAKARLPLVVAVHRSIVKENVPARSTWTAEIERLAREEYPPAMLLHATILGRRGEYDAAFKWLEKKIIPRISPTRQHESMFANIQLREILDSPHRTLALLRASHDEQFGSAESRQKADEAVRIAALEYNDPAALAEYASLMMNENNLDMYEECMCKAASGGNGKAALYLGNFYYLTYLGKYATRGERDSNQSRWPPTWMSRLLRLDDPARSSSVLNKSFAYIASFLNRSLPQKSYIELSKEWYVISLARGEKSAAFMLALLCRETAKSASERKDAAVLLAAGRQDGDPDLVKPLAELEKHWFDPDYEPTLPKKFFAVR